MTHSINLPPLVIASGETVSNRLREGEIGSATALSIGAPATLTGTVTVEVSLNGGGTFHTLQSGGADVEIAAGKAIVIDFNAWDQIRLRSSAAEGGTRTFRIRIREG